MYDRWLGPDADPRELLFSYPPAPVYRSIIMADYHKHLGRRPWAFWKYDMDMDRPRDADEEGREHNRGRSTT